MKLILLISLWFSAQSGFPEENSLIIVNKFSHEMVLYQQHREVFRAPIAVGKTKELTPEGLFEVKVLAENPYYRKLNIPGGDPKNPLGSRWIGFDARGTDGRIYGLHGTNQPSSIGESVSAGCIRLHNKDVEKLFRLIDEGTDVLIVDRNENMESLYIEWYRTKWEQVL